MALLAFEDAMSAVLEGAVALEAERIPLDDARGRVLAESVLAHRAMPEFDHSAMDGYALDVESVDVATTRGLPVVGESRAGGALPAFTTGTACRIFTGARVPDGANAVIMQEDVRREGERIVVARAATPRVGQNIRRRGEDLEQGSVALVRGSRLTPGMLGLAASLDLTHLMIARRPRVAILATGDELRAPGSPPREGSVPESNVHVVGAIARAVGAEVRALPYAVDDAVGLQSALESALEGCDVLVTIGGASVGDHDRVRPTLEALGARFAFAGVSMRPGKPTGFATFGPTRVLALPGNPASATLAFHLFGVPLLRALQGDATPAPRFVELSVLGSHRRNLGGHCDGRDDFLRGTLEVHDGTLAVRLASRQASGAVTSFAFADALVRLAGTRERIESGDRLPTVRLADLGG